MMAPMLDPPAAIHRDGQLVERPQHADVRHPACTATAEHKADRRAGHVSPDTAGVVEDAAPHMVVVVERECGEPAAT